MRKKLVEDKGYVSKLSVQTHLSIDSQSPVIKMFSSWYREDTFLVRSFMACFQVEKGKSAPPASAVARVPSAKKSPRATVAYFGVAC